MSTRILTALAVILTVVFVADTGYQVYRLTQNQPATWVGMILLVPIVFLLKKLSAPAASSTAERNAA